MNFDQILAEAQKTADKRKKAYVELKKQAPTFLRAYAEKMKELGYKYSYFKAKLFLDQAEFSCYSEYGRKESWLEFDFNTLALTEATEEESEFGEFGNVYDGAEYPLDFSTNTDGAVLLGILESLPVRLKKCIEAKEKEVSRMEAVLSK
jgi:hypothetical protein